MCGVRVTNPDEHTKKCQGCRTFRKKQDDDELTAEDKTALSPAIVQLMQQTAPEKLDEEAARNEAELSFLEASVKESAKWLDCGGSSRAVEEI